MNVKLHDLAAIVCCNSLGSWLSVNGEAIYGSKPWTYQNDTVNPDVW